MALNRLNAAVSGAESQPRQLDQFSVGVYPLTMRLKLLPNNSLHSRQAAISMNTSADYTPPKIWSATQENGGRFASINRLTAGPTHDKDLPVGRHPL